LLSGAPWRDFPERCGLRITCDNLFIRLSKAGIWDWSMDDIIPEYDGDMQMIDGTSIRAHQRAATAKRGSRSLSRSPVAYDR
jgi:transposase